MKRIYEVCTIELEISKRAVRNGKTFREVYYNMTCQTPSSVKRFETFDEAQAYYMFKGYYIPDKAVDKGHYYFGELRYIVVNDYEIDEDGNEEFVDFVRWEDCSFPILWDD